jgi:hypothetical protein
VGNGSISPFGDPLPLVTGWAIDDETASLALVVEDPDEVVNAEPWNELLFAVSGLRHELRGGASSAIGTPTVVAIVQGQEHERRLRTLVETLSDRYILFSRVELNVVVDDGNPVDIDRALAPLLPLCRTALREGIAIGTEVLGTLADELKASVIGLADSAEKELHEHADLAARRYAEALSAIVRPRPDGESPTLIPFGRVELHNFRSFADGQAPLGQMSLVDGLNGTGKSSLIEALEILWSGSSQRKPADESDDVYDRHLAHDGTGSWEIVAYEGNTTIEPLRRSRTDDRGLRGLPRNLLSQDGSIDIVGEPAAARYAELLRVTGLAVPELMSECTRLNREARDGLNRVLSKVGIASVKANMRGLDAVRSGLANSTPHALPPADRIRTAEEELSKLAGTIGIHYRPAEVTVDKELLDELATEALAGAAVLRPTGAFTRKVAEANAGLLQAASTAEKRAEALEQLARSLVIRAELSRVPPEVAPDRDEPPPIPRSLASTLMNVGRSLERTLLEIRASNVGALASPWRERVELFLERAQEAIDAVPRSELEAVLKEQPEKPSTKVEPPAVSAEAFDAAGLFPMPAAGLLPDGLAPACRLVASALRDYAAAMKAQARQIANSPLSRLEGSEEELLETLAQFEVARALKTPVTRTQEQLLTRLLSGPLEPLLGELIGALTRFEWYFHPLQMRVRRGAVELGGVATDSAELDLRMLLNSGERAIVSLAWFLALHLLQPPPQRAVLLLDDPFSTLDENNCAALLATLRTLTRLSRPEMLLISTHDRLIAEAVTREFTPFNGWPSEVAHLHFLRSPDGTSAVEGVVSETSVPDYASELSRLGIGGAAEFMTSDA